MRAITTRNKHAMPELDAIELGRPHLRMRNPIMAGYLEGITQALYDVYAVATTTAAPKLTLFAVPQGQAYNFGGVTSFVKTAAHTSMLQAGVLPAPNKAIVRAISVLVQASDSIADLAHFGMVFFQFNVNGKSYQDTVINRVPGGGGSSCSTTGAISNGWPDTRNTYSLAYGGVPIEQQQNFNVIIDPTISEVGATAFQTAAAFYSLVFLDGTLFRAVQ